MNNRNTNENINRQNIRRKNAIKKKKKSSLALNITFILSISLTLFLLFTFINQKVKIANLNKESQLIKAQHDNLNREIDELVKEIEEINSLEYIEKRAREDLGMIKKDEKIYINPTESIDESVDEMSDEETLEENDIKE